MILLDDAGLVDLSALNLSPAALEARRGFVNASEVHTILYGEDDDRRRLSRYHLLGETDDLSNRLYVVMGSFTELLNLSWLRAQSGLVVSREQLLASNPLYPWLRATLDGRILDPAWLVETKHVNGWMRPLDVLARYMPQCQAQMAADGTYQAKLAVIYGNARWECYDIAFDPFWWDEVTPVLMEWQDAIAQGIDPVPPAWVAPVPLDYGDLVEHDMDASNAWAVLAEQWSSTVLAAKLNETAKAEIKKLMPPDARRAWGHGVQIKRAKNNALTLKTLAEDE